MLPLDEDHPFLESFLQLVAQGLEVVGRRPRSAQSGPKNTPTGEALTMMVSSMGLALRPVTATTGATNSARPM